MYLGEAAVTVRQDIPEKISFCFDNVQRGGWGFFVKSKVFEAPIFLLMFGHFQGGQVKLVEALLCLSLG